MPPDSRLPQAFRTHLKPRQAELLVALVEEGHLGRAADRTHMTQPAASKALAQIENLVGLPLFHRSAQGMRATPAGDVMAAYARHLLGIGERTAAELAALHARAAHTLRIGVLPSTASTLAPRLIRALLQDDTALQVDLTEGVLHDLIELLRHGSLDLVLGRLEHRGPGDELVEHALYPEPIVVVCRPGHPLARHESVSPGQLAGCAWILPQAGTVLHDRLAELFRQVELPLPVARVHSSATMANLELIRDTDLLAVLPLGLARQYAARGDLRILPMAASFQFGAIGAILRRNQPPSGALQAALDWLLAQRG